MFLEPHRDVASVVLERLAVLEALRHQTGLLAGHLYEVALAVPVADLQRLEAGFQTLLGLEARQPVVGPVAELARLVQLRRVALAYDLAALLGDSCGDELPHPRRLLHRPEHPREQGGTGR